MKASQEAFNATAKALEEAQDWHQQGVETILKNHPEWESEPPESFVNLVKRPDKAAVALAEALPLLASAGILTVAGQPNVAAGLMYVSEGQEAADQAIADGASEEDAAIAYAVYGTVAAALEKMQLESILKVAKGSYNALLNRTAQKVAKGGLRTAAWGTIKVAAQEALEEMAQGQWQEITAKMVYDKDIPGGLVGTIDRRAQEAYLGFLMGLIPGVAGGVAGRAQTPGAEAAPGEAVVEPVAEPVMEPVMEPVAEVGEPAAEAPAVEPTEAAEVKAAPVAEPVTGPVTGPVTEPKPRKPRLSRHKALEIGHELPKKMGWSEAQRRDFMVETVGKPSMKDMKPTELRTVVAAMQEQARDQGLLAPEDYAKTIFIGAREVGTQEFIDEAVATVGGLKNRAAKTPKMQPRKHAERKRGWVGTIKVALTGVDNLSIPHLMRQIGAAAEGVVKEVGVTNWRRSQHHISAVFRGGVDMLNAALDKAGVTNADLAKMSAAADPRLELIKQGREIVGRPRTKYHKVTINGKQFVLSLDELMDMYLASLQDMGPGHIESGGFEIRGYKTGPIDEASMDELRAIVEADAGAMAAMNAAIDIADNYNAPQLNYTHGRLNPETIEDIANKTNYWHLEPKQVPKIKGKQTYTISLLENKNILKPRTGGKQPLVIRGFFPKFFAVQYAVSEYVGMAEELRLMNIILNNDQVIEGLEAKGYTDVRNNLKQLLEWVQSKGSVTTSTDKLLSRIMHGAFRAVLHYSPEVIASQYMSTGHYAGVIDPKYVPLLTVPPTPGLVKEMLANNPVVWQRYYAGGQSAELAELGELDVTLRLLTGKHADLNKTGIAAQQTDLAAFAQGWKIAKAITKDTGIQEGTPEFWDAVNDKAEELWDTQPSWDKWNKSVNTSQRGIRRLPFLFRSYFEKSLMLLHSANATYEASPKKAADRAKQAQVYGAVLGSQMATALIRTFIGWAVWRKRKSVWDYLGAMAGAPFSMVAIVGGYMGRVVGSLIKILAGEKQQFEGEPISSLPVQTAEELLVGLNQMADAAAYHLAGEDKKAETQMKAATRNLIINTGTMLGIPARQIDKITKAMEKEETGMYPGGYLP
jgi:hypothetical protein